MEAQQKGPSRPRLAPVFWEAGWYIYATLPADFFCFLLLLYTNPAYPAFSLLSTFLPHSVPSLLHGRNIPWDLNYISFEIFFCPHVLFLFSQGSFVVYFVLFFQDVFKCLLILACASLFESQSHSGILWSLVCMGCTCQMVSLLWADQSRPSIVGDHPFSVTEAFSLRLQFPQRRIL